MENIAQIKKQNRIFILLRAIECGGKWNRLITPFESGFNGGSNTNQVEWGITFSSSPL